MTEPQPPYIPKHHKYNDPTAREQQRVIIHQDHSTAESYQDHRAAERQPRHGDNVYEPLLLFPKKEEYEQFVPL